MTGNPPLVVVLGPTAVGKTGFAIKLAAALNGEIVSADSRQIYRHMDIGTAKPTPEQRARVPHHLLDLAEPDETLSVAEFQRLAYHTVEGIQQRGRLPLLVGGTGQYITAVVEGWTIPEVEPNPALRAELEAYAAEHGAEALRERLRSLDPEAAQRVDFRNIRRVVRAIEIVEATGQPMNYARRKQPPAYTFLQIGLTMDRERLYARADLRIDQMMRDGWLEEVRRLLALGYGRDLPSMSSLGYKELGAFLAGEMTLNAALAATRAATHDFIRRQYTWFRGHDSGIQWYDVEHISTAERTADVKHWLEAQPG